MAKLLGHGPIQTDEEGIYNTIPTKYFGKGFRVPLAQEEQKERKDLLEKAKSGDRVAISIMKTQFKITKWLSEGKEVI